MRSLPKGCALPVPVATYGRDSRVVEGKPLARGVMSMVIVVKRGLTIGLTIKGATGPVEEEEEEEGGRRGEEPVEELRKRQNKKQENHSNPVNGEKPTGKSSHFGHGKRDEVAGRVNSARADRQVKARLQFTRHSRHEPSE